MSRHQGGVMLNPPSYLNLQVLWDNPAAEVNFKFKVQHSIYGGHLIFQEKRVGSGRRN
jgi:hypothetical protein